MSKLAPPPIEFVVGNFANAIEGGIDRRSIFVASLMVVTRLHKHHPGFALFDRVGRGRYRNGAIGRVLCRLQTGLVGLLAGQAPELLVSQAFVFFDVQPGSRDGRNVKRRPLGVGRCASDVLLAELPVKRVPGAM